MTKKASPYVVDDHKLSGPLVFLSIIYKNLQRRRTVCQKAVDGDSVPAPTVQAFLRDCFGQPFDLFLFWFSLCKMCVNNNSLSAPFCSYVDLKLLGLFITAYLHNIWHSGILVLAEALEHSRK